jgi:hypothetical protein
MALTFVPLSVSRAFDWPAHPKRPGHIGPGRWCGLVKSDSNDGDRDAVPVEKHAVMKVHGDDGDTSTEVGQAR